MNKLIRSDFMETKRQESEHEVTRIARKITEKIVGGVKNDVRNVFFTQAANKFSRSIC